MATRTQGGRFLSVLVPAIPVSSTSGFRFGPSHLEDDPELAAVNLPDLEARPFQVGDRVPNHVIGLEPYEQRVEGALDSEGEAVVGWPMLDDKEASARP